MHLRINRLLDIHQNNQHLKEFLAARNPRHQHSSSFQSYLIKPENNSNEQLLSLELFKLKQAITMMNDIAEYMNGMQQLYEDFGQSFESIAKSYSEEHNKVGDFQLYFNWFLF